MAATHHVRRKGLARDRLRTVVPPREDLFFRGVRRSDGCIGLLSEADAQLFDLAPVGTQVRAL